VAKKVATKRAKRWQQKSRVFCHYFATT